MRSIICSLLVPVCLTMIMVGCASGPKYKDIAAEIPPVPQSQGRIYFYRDGSPVGSAIQPPIYLNGDKVGKSVPGGFFYVDRQPGEYKVKTSTEVERILTFMLADQEKKYVRTKVSIGLIVGHVLPILEDEEEALKTLNKSAYIGDK